MGLLAHELEAGASGLEAVFDLLADRLEQRLESLAAAGLDAIRGAAPSWLSAADPSWARLGEGLLASLRTEHSSFRLGLLPGGLPAADAYLVELAGEAGDLEALLPGYRFAQTSLWGAWFELVQAAAASRRTKRELLARGSRYFLRYAELVSRFLGDAYRQRMERRSGLASHPAGGPFAPPNLFAGAHPEFDLDRFHLGAIVWGEPAEEVARELADRLDRLVAVIAEGTAAWVCLSGQGELGGRRLQLLRDFAPRAGVRMAVGLEGFGVDGLRLSFRQAMRARALSTPGDPVTHYAEVAVEALSLGFEEDARAFIAHELRGIDDDSVASARLRETLTAYFAADLNAASAAAQLGVHHQTVANRLRTIEDRLGHPLRARTLELALALRLHRRTGTANR